MKNAYFITTGHSPREDITADIRNYLSSEVAIHEMGAMDKYSVEEVKTLFAPIEGEATLVSRLNNGEMVAFSEPKALGLIQDCITRACEAGADIIIILCTSEFPRFKSSVPIIYPGELEKSIATAVGLGLKVDYLFPFETHAKGMHQGWEEAGLPGDYRCYHHSSGDSAHEIISFFADDKPSMIVLDCMGYSFEFADEIRSKVDTSIILPRALIVNTIHALLGIHA